MFTALDSDPHLRYRGSMEEDGGVDNHKEILQDSGGNHESSIQPEAPPKPGPARRITKKLYFRNGAPAYWACFLIPTAIAFADQKFLLQSLPAVGIIFYNCILLVLTHVVGGDAMLRKCWDYLRVLNIVLALLAMLYGYSINRDNKNLNLMFEYTLWAGLNFSFPYVFMNIIRYYPRSFSFGEGMIVTSAFVYTYWEAFHNFIQNRFYNIKSFPEPAMLTIFQELGFLVTVMASRGILFFMRPKKAFFLQEIFSICSKAAFALFFGKLSNIQDDLTFMGYWILGYFFKDPNHLAFLLTWTLLLAVTIIFVLVTVGETNTVHRKFFHVLVCLVYLPAVLNDLNFIFFCSTFVLYGFIIVEVTRVLRFEIWGFSVGSFIDSGVSNFRDSRDSGPLLLTPIYLLAGCSAPIWLSGLHIDHISNVDRTPEELAAAITGILSVGVGDTVASVVGSMYGQLHWPGSKKTIEGSICSMIAQVGVVGLLCWSGLLPYTTVSLIALCICSIVNAIVEALTTEIDNLVVPLVAFNTFHLVLYISDYF